MQSSEGPFCDECRPQHTLLRCHVKACSLAIPTVARYSRHHLDRKKLLRYAKGGRLSYCQNEACAISSVSTFHPRCTSGGYNLHPAEMEAVLQHFPSPYAGKVLLFCVLASANGCVKDAQS